MIPVKIITLVPVVDRKGTQSEFSDYLLFLLLVFHLDGGFQTAIKRFLLLSLWVPSATSLNPSSIRLSDPLSPLVTMVLFL
jgi:hypothetical protein